MEDQASDLKPYGQTRVDPLQVPAVPVHKNVLNRLASHFWRFYDFEAVGEGMSEHAHNDKKARFITTWILLSIFMLAAGFMIKDWCDSDELSDKSDLVDKKEAIIESKDDLIQKKDDTATRYQQEVEELTKQHQDDQSQINGLKEERDNDEIKLMVYKSGNTNAPSAEIDTAALNNSISIAITKALAPYQKSIQDLSDQTKQIASAAVVEPRRNRILSQDALDRIKTLLTPSLGDLIKQVDLGYPIGDSEAADLAVQLKPVFEQAGFQVNFFAGMFMPPPKGIQVHFKSLPLQANFFNALNQLGKELNVKIAGSYDDKFDPSKISIIIGSQ